MEVFVNFGILYLRSWHLSRWLIVIGASVLLVMNEDEERYQQLRSLDIRYSLLC